MLTMCMGLLFSRRRRCLGFCILFRCYPGSAISTSQAQGIFPLPPITYPDLRVHLHSQISFILVDKVKLSALVWLFRSCLFSRCMFFLCCVFFLVRLDVPFFFTFIWATILTINWHNDSHKFINTTKFSKFSSDYTLR